MDAQDFRSLQEAYLDVYPELDEGYKRYSNKKVFDKMDKLKSKGDLESIGRAGQIRDKLIKRSFSSQIPDKEEKLNRNKSEKYKRSKTVSDNTQKKKSFPNRLTRSDKQGIRDSYDYYDTILSHLLDEGYAETPEAAKNIMVNMSEEWRQSIVEMGENIGREPKAVGKPERPTAMPGETYKQRQERMKPKSVREGNLLEREMDEPGERDDRPDVKSHNKSVKYRPRQRRPRIEDDPRYGTPMDRSGKFKY